MTCGYLWKAPRQSGNGGGIETGPPGIGNDVTFEHGLLVIGVGQDELEGVLLDRMARALGLAHPAGCTEWVGRALPFLANDRLLEGRRGGKAGRTVVTGNGDSLFLDCADTGFHPLSLRQAIRVI